MLSFVLVSTTLNVGPPGTKVGPPVQNLTEPDVTHVPPHASNDLQPVAEKPQLPILNQSSTKKRIVSSECQSGADLSDTPNDSIMAVYVGRDETSNNRARLVRI